MNKPVGELVVLNAKYSTTRRVVEEKKKYEKVAAPVDQGRNTVTINQGGMRTHGYSKRTSDLKPLISIVTVVCNGKETMKSAVESVLNQTYDNLEYIIVDGDSDDGTLDIIKQYDSAIDYWVSEKDEGVYYAMNKAVSLARGDYILFLGCDDVLFDVIHEVVPSFDFSNTSYYGDVIFTSKNQCYGGFFDPVKLVHGNIPSQAIFYSRYVFEEFEFNLKYHALADYEMNIRLFSDKKFGFKYIDKTIALYNDETGLSSTSADHIFIKDFPKIIFKNYTLLNYFKYLYIKLILKNTW